MWSSCCLPEGSPPGIHSWQRYLAESQDLDIEGNIMYNMLTGDAPELKVVGTTPAGQQPGIQPISRILQTPWTNNRDPVPSRCAVLQGRHRPFRRPEHRGIGHYG